MTNIEAIKSLFKKTKEPDKPTVRYVCKTHGEVIPAIRIGANGPLFCIRCVADAFPLEEVRND